MWHSVGLSSRIERYTFLHDLATKSSVIGGIDSVLPMFGEVNRECFLTDR